MSLSTKPIGPEQTVRVYQAIATAASESGVSFDYLLQQARIESSLDPAAKARSSSASGLFQFTKQTWLATVRTHGHRAGLGWAANAIERDGTGHFFVRDPDQRATILALRYQPEAASHMAAAFASDNAAHLSRELGIAPEPVDLYLAHFLGAAGATKFLEALAQSPNSPAASSFPEAAAANRSIFYSRNGQPRSFEEIRTHFSGAFRNTTDTPYPLTIAQSMHVQPAEHWRPSSQAMPQTKPLRMLDIEPMANRLSLDIAHRAYQRLAEARDK